MKKFKLTAAASAMAMACASAYAADQPFFTVTEISDNADEYGYKLAQKNDIYSDIIQPYDWWSYFEANPTTIDLADYHTYAIGCIYDRAVCGSFYDDGNDQDGKGHSFFKALHENTSYISSLLSYGEQLDMFSGVRRNLGDDGESMIAGWVENPKRTFISGVRYPVVWSKGEKIVLEQKKGFGVASSSLRTDDGSFLIGGASSETDFTDGGYFRECYSDYDEDSFSYAMRNCPGYSNQPVVWSFDPSTNKVTGTLELAHFNPANLNSADIKAIVKRKGIYYAFGHSATKNVGMDTLSIATWWSFEFKVDSNNNGTFSIVSGPNNATGIDRPGQDDKHYGATWFADANDNGYAIGNIRYSSVNRLAYPIEMFVYNIDSNSSNIALQNVPFKGASNEAVAINNNNLVVGIADNANSQYATVDGMPREKEGYIYNVESGKYYSLNDLICTSSTCEINGRYYYIYNVGDINDNNTIIANAYRYDTNKDWANYTNVKNVTVMLTSDKFINNKDIDENYKVSYDRKEITYGEEKGGGGSGSMGGISVMLLGVMAFLRIRKLKK